MSRIAIRIRKTMWNNFNLIILAYILMTNVFIIVNFLTKKTPELLFVLAIIIPYSVIYISDMIKLHRGTEESEI